MSENAPDPDFTIIQRPIVSDDDVNAAMHVLSWIAAKEAAAEAALKLQFAEARTAAAELKRITIEGATFTYDEIRKSLDKALSDFATAQRSRLFVKRQTASFGHGEIKQRKKNASVSLAKGVTEKEVIPKLANEPRYVRTKQEIDFPSLLSDRRKDLLTDQQLSDWGLVYDAGEGDKHITIVPK